MSIDKIISRVQKLLSMSRSDNEHEAAQAAARASVLMAEYNLTEAMLRVEDSSRAAEVIVTDVPIYDPTKKRTAWRESIASAVAKSLGCRMFISASNAITAFGREGATQAWNYTCQYLFNEIDRLADVAWEREGVEAADAGQSIRRWKNAFRVGAASIVAARLRDATKAAQEARGLKRRAMEPTYTASPNKESQALMIMERDEQEVETAYMDMYKQRNFRNLGGIGTVSSRTGYNAGREAGGTVSLGGGRAALGAGMGRLK